jgi:hypothetical protein
MSAYEETVRDGVIVLKAPAGALHGARVTDGEPFRQHLLSAVERGDVVLDLSGVPGGGDQSVGFRTIMIGVRDGVPRGHAIFLAAPDPILREKFQIARFHLVAAVFDTVDDALKALATGNLARAMHGGPRGAKTLPPRFIRDGA